jgi:putative transposase
MSWQTMKEAYAVRRTVPPSAEIEARIEQRLSVGVGENPRETLSELARLGARLIIQRAVEDEFDAWLGRARYERRPRDAGDEPVAENGLRNGFRPRTVQTAEGELEIEIPQVRHAAETFASRLFPRTPKLLRTEPLKALVIGAFVRGLSMRDVESLCEQAGLGKLSKTTASRMCEELKERFAAFQRRDLYDIRLVALFLDATFIAVRPDGPKEGVQVAWGFTEDGEWILLAVSLGMRESFEDWQSLGRDLIARGLGAPMLIVADGAPGLTKAIEQCWPSSDRQRCCVHRARNFTPSPRPRARTGQARLLADAGGGDQRTGRQATTPSARRPARQRRVHRRGTVPGRRSRRAGGASALPAAPPSAMAQHQPARTVPRPGQTPHHMMGRFPGETSCLTLVWAVLDLLITHQTNGIHFNALDRQRLKRDRYQGNEPTIPEEVTAA